MPRITLTRVCPPPGPMSHNIRIVNFAILLIYLLSLLFAQMCILMIQACRAIRTEMWWITPLINRIDCIHLPWALARYGLDQPGQLLSAAMLDGLIAGTLAPFQALLVQVNSECGRDIPLLFWCCVVAAH